jgi:hypothetical protein
LFLWLAIAGPGRVAVDPWLQRAFGTRNATGSPAEARAR